MANGDVHTQPPRRPSGPPVFSINRETELRLLDRAWDSARTGNGCAVLVLGEAGIGKSTLETGFLNQIEPKAGRVLAVRCFEQEHALPYIIWRNLATNHPELRETFPDPLGESSPRATNAADLARRVSIQLRTLADQKPVIVAVDDIHLADTPSLGVLRALGQRLSGSHILLLVTCQTPLQDDSPSSHFIQSLLRESPVHTIELEPMGTENIAAVVDQCYPDLSASIRPIVVREITRLSGGNTLYAAELLSALDGRLSGTADTEQISFDAIPLSLRQMVGHRVASLPYSTQETLKLAAIIGEKVDPDLLALVTTLPMTQVLSDLEQALTAEILAEDSSGDLRFRHGAVFQTLRDSQSQLRQRALHRRILDVLRDHPTTTSSEIAHRAELAGDLVTAYHALEAAASEAESLFALPEAARLYEKAASFASATNADPEHQDRLRLALADALLRQNPDGATREIERVISRSLARDDRLTLARARQRQALITYEAGRRADALSLLDEAIPDLERFDDRSTLAEALVCYVYCALLQSDFSVVDTMAQRLLELSTHLNEPSYRAVALMMTAVARVARGEPANSSLLAREAVSILAEVGRLDTATAFATAAFMRVELLSNLHRPEMVDDLIARGEQLDREGDRLLGSEPSQCMIGFAYWNYHRGNWDRVRADVPDPANLRSQRAPQVLRDIGHTVLADLAIAEGRPSDAQSLLSYIAPRPGPPQPDTSYQQWLFAVQRLIELRIAERDLDGARQWLEAFDRTLEQNPHVPGELLFDLARARYLLATGGAEDAVQTLLGVTSGAERTHNMLALVQAQRLLAETHLALNQIEQALDAARRAEHLAASCALVYERVCASVQIAEVLMRSGDRSGEAMDLLAAASETLTRLGATAQLAKVEKLMRRPMKTSSGEHLTRRELDVLRLVVGGLTDAEIGNRLYISPRTVGTHISNMLGKTGTSNRVELATWAISHSLV